MNNIKNKKAEGMKLAAIVRDKDTGETKYIKDSDYNSKQAFKQDLQANGYIVSKIHDARDAYIIDHSDYRGINDLKKDLKFYEDMLKDAKKNYPSLVKTYEDDYNRVKKLYDEAMNQPLYESKLLENNNDIILYHGSPNKNLTYLDIGKNNTTGDQYGKGIYLTTNIDEAQQYTGPDGKIYKVKLSDNIKLFNLKNKLDDNIKEQLKLELNNANNSNINNYISMFNRNTYITSNKEDGLKFYKDKEAEWKSKDNKYFGNRPLVAKENEKFIITYTDYNNLDKAINNMTGEDLYKVFSGDVDPEVFITIITSSGYDGIITRNNNWYIIYKNINNIKLTESVKLQEVSRNEMLATSKLQTITRYKKSVNYKGFTIADIDTTSIFTTNSFRVTCRVGDYWDTVEMENILYWVEMEAEKEPNNQINTKSVTRAIMDAIDGTDIKVDCTCPDFIYRFAYKCSKMGCKYGKQETRPAKITNPNDYGYSCKHLISMLSNKKWLQQSSGTLMNFLEERIDDVNKFLRRPKDDQLTLPNELARRNARKGFYTKLFKDRLEDEEDNENIENNVKDNDKDIDNNNNTNVNNNINNVVGNNSSTNKLNNINNNEEEEDDNES